MSEVQENMMTRRASGKIPALIIHAVIFYAFWACWTLWLRPPIKEAMNGSLLFELFGSAVKMLVWFVPAILLVKRFEPDMYVGAKQMFTEKVPLKSVLFWSLIFCLLGSGTLIKGLRGGTLHINPEFTLTNNQWLLFVGITEEAVFRGWMLNATAKSEKDWKMLLLNAVMFVCIHIPTWILHGQLHAAFAQFGFVSIIFVSVLFSFSFLKHKNLLLPVWLHMLYDFMLEFFAA
ncbi:MAG: CPBP family intramembrane metalloprotease [Oscillospiraceae bacterium]|nr:CPBP family intramembrane metalloprotease [Oscillospiraceae bacterium]